jgi:hypothetical protein
MAGSTTIRATAEGITGSAAVTVVVSAPPAAEVATVTVTPAVAAVPVGQSQGFTATLRDANGNLLTGRSVAWSSTNAAVATVSSGGLMTGIAQGVATIRATSEGRSGDATVTVTVPTPTGPNLFSADWSTATGNSDNAISDGGRWNVNFCAPSRSSVLNVVSGASLGWTKTPNVMSVRYLGESCAQFQRNNAVPASTSHYARFYFRNDATAGSNHHPVTYNCCGAIQVVPWSRFTNTSGITINIRTSAPYPYNAWAPGRPGSSGHLALAHRTWYRYEWHLEYVSATSYRIWPRVYDMAGNLLYDAATFVPSDYSGSGHTLASWYAAGNSLRISDVELARHFGGGNEGPAGAPNTGEYYYFADMALSLSGWIGR